MTILEIVDFTGVWMSAFAMVECNVQETWTSRKCCPRGADGCFGVAGERKRRGSGGTSAQRIDYLFFFGC